MVQATTSGARDDRRVGGRWVHTGRRPRLAVVERHSARGGAEQQQRAAPGERLAGAARGAHLLPRCQCCPARCLRQALGAGVALRAAVGRGARGAAELAPQVPRASLPGAGGRVVGSVRVGSRWGGAGRGPGLEVSCSRGGAPPATGRCCCPPRRPTAAAKSGPCLTAS